MRRIRIFFLPAEGADSGSDDPVPTTSKPCHTSRAGRCAACERPSSARPYSCAQFGLSGSQGAVHPTKIAQTACAEQCCCTSSVAPCGTLKTAAACAAPAQVHRDCADPCTSTARSTARLPASMHDSVPFGGKAWPCWPCVWHNACVPGQRTRAPPAMLTANGCLQGSTTTRVCLVLPAASSACSPRSLLAPAAAAGARIGRTKTERQIAPQPRQHGCSMRRTTQCLSTHDGGGGGNSHRRCRRQPRRCEAGGWGHVSCGVRLDLPTGALRCAAAR